MSIQTKLEDTRSERALESGTTAWRADVETQPDTRRALRLQRTTRTLGRQPTVSSRRPISTPDVHLRDAVWPLLQVAVGSVVGLMLLPVLFGAVAPDSDALKLGWFVVSAVICGWLLFTSAHLSWLLGVALAHTAAISQSRARRDQQPMGVRRAETVARLLIAVALVALLQAILRRPLVLMLGDWFRAVHVEAAWAALALATLFVLLFRLYRLGRGGLQVVTRQALDLLFPTVRLTDRNQSI